MRNSRHIFLRKALVLTLLLLVQLKGIAQVYPVQTNVSTSGPYFNYLSYYADENHHLQAVVTLTDFNAGSVDCRLRMRIQGPGYELKTNPNIVVGAPFTLTPGVPNFINGIDLAPYFQASNLLIEPSGINIDALPEGFTTICVDVIRDGATQEVLSTNNCTGFFLQQFQPAQALLPMCGANISTDEIFHTFQWAPPIGYVPSIGAELNYTFSLYEWNDPNNFNIFETGQGLVYSTQTTTPLVQLSNYEVLLQEGMTYVWRIESQITSNGLPVDMIVNNGISAPCTFTYGEALGLEESLAQGLLINLEADGTGERKGNAYWTVIDSTPNEGLSTYGGYKISYRKKPTGSESFEYEWIEEDLINNTFSYKIFQLEPNTTYEVFVQGNAGSFISEPSNTAEFTTLEERVYACGEADMPYMPENYTPLETAMIGMSFEIGQFTLLVTEVEDLSTPGHFKGKGLVPIAFLGGASAKVRFDDLLVDDEFRVREGQVDVITDGLDNWLNEQYMQFIDPIYVDGTVDSIYVDTTAGTAWVVVDGVAQEFTFDPIDYPIIIHDENGMSFTIYPDGTIEEGSYFEYSNDQFGANITANDVATFEQDNNDAFGFDPKAHLEWHENYEILLLSDSTAYFVANKSMAENTAGTVKVIPPSGIAPSFTLDGVSLTGYSGGILTLPNNLSKGEYEVHVLNGTVKIGKLNLFVYAEKERNIVIVPMTNAPVNQGAIENAINSTLGEANIKFNIIVADQFNDAVFTTSNNIDLPEDVGLMNKYSQEMKDLRDAYKADSSSIDTTNAYYVFVVPGFSDAGTDGYMMRGRSLGFVQSGADTLTYAHELGHGMGALEHTWKNNGPNQGTTSNLMDYVTIAENLPNTNLTKAQWKELRDVDVVPSLWDTEEDAQMISMGVNADSDILKLGQTFFTPAGLPITLDGIISELYFATYEDKWHSRSTGEAIEESEFIVGSLVRFKLNGVTYSGSQSHTFDGYRDENDNYYEDTKSFIIPDSVPTLVTPIFDASGFKILACHANKPIVDFNVPDTSRGKGPCGQLNDLMTYFDAELADAGYEIPGNFSYTPDPGIIAGIADLLFHDSYGNIMANNLTAYHTHDIVYYDNGPKNLNPVYTPPPIIFDKFIGTRALDIYRIIYEIDQDQHNLFTCIPSLNSPISQALFHSIESSILQDEEEYFNTNTVVQDQLENFTPSLYHNIDFRIESATDDLPVTSFTQEEVNGFKIARIRSLLSTVNYLLGVSQDLAIVNNSSESLDANNFVAFLDNISKNEPVILDCIYANLSLEKKLEIIYKVREWTWGDNREELIVRIFESLSVSDFLEVYDHLKADNCDLIHDLMGDLWWSHLDRFANALSMHLVNKEKDINPELSNLVTYPLYHDGFNPFDSWNVSVFSGCDVTLTEMVWNSYPGRILNRPFDEIIEFVIADDFTYRDPEGNILREGDRVKLPAFWAYYFLNEEADATNTILLRLSLEAAIIAATAGTSTPWIVGLEAGLLAADFTISWIQNENAHNSVINDIANTFNVVTAIVFVPQGIIGAAQLTSSLAKWIKPVIVSNGQKVFKVFKNQFKQFNTLLKRGNTSNVDELIVKLDDILYELRNAPIVNGVDASVVASQIKHLEEAQMSLRLSKKCDKFDTHLLTAEDDWISVAAVNNAGQPSTVSTSIGKFDSYTSSGEVVLKELSEFEYCATCTNPFPGTIGGQGAFKIQLANQKVRRGNTILEETLDVVQTTDGQFYFRVNVQATLASRMASQGHTSIKNWINSMDELFPAGGDAQLLANLKNKIDAMSTQKLNRLNDALQDGAGFNEQMGKLVSELALNNGNKFDELLDASFSDNLLVLASDLKGNAALADEFVANVDLLDAWAAISSIGVSSNIAWVKQIDGWFNNGITSVATNNIVEFSTSSGKKFARIENDKLIFDYSGFGGNAVMNPNKGTTGIGKFSEDFSNPAASGTRQFLGHASSGLEGLPNGVIARVTSGGPPNNSLAFLDLPEAQYNTLLNDKIKDALTTEYGTSIDVSLINAQSISDVENIIRNDIIPGIDDLDLEDIIETGVSNGKEVFWTSYNKPFLEEAFQRGDDIRLFSDPQVFQGPGFYGRELEEITKFGGLADTYGYAYDASIATYIKQ